jgi:hypothetical protein
MLHAELSAPGAARQEGMQDRFRLQLYIGRVRCNRRGTLKPSA